MKLTFSEFVADARKAVVVLGGGVAAAVSVGVIDDATAGTITGVAGAALAILVYLVPNAENRKKLEAVNAAPENPAPGSSPLP